MKILNNIIDRYGPEGEASFLSSSAKKIFNNTIKSDNNNISYRVAWFNNYQVVVDLR